MRWERPSNAVLPPDAEDHEASYIRVWREMKHSKFTVLLAMSAALVMSCDNPAEDEEWPDGAYLYLSSVSPDTAISWSPYGNVLLFTTFGYTSPCLYGFDGLGSPVLITSSELNESAGTNGAWNAERGKIAYTAWSGDSLSEIRTIPGNLGAVKVVLDNGELHLHPTWNPAGDTLVMSTMVADVWELWIGEYDEDSMYCEPLYMDDGNCLRPSYSSDGEWILFQFDGASSSDIWVVRPDGSDPRAVVSDASDDIHPCWGPEDNWFAFSSDRSGQWDIWIGSIASDTLIRVTDDPGTDLYPAWNPGFGWFAFASDRTGGVGQYDIFSIESPSLP